MGDIIMSVKLKNALFLVAVIVALIVLGALGAMNPLYLPF